MLNHSDLLELKRWNTPTIFNGWEQITQHDVTADGSNLEPLTDFMPHLGPMVGYAVTVVIEPSNKAHRSETNALRDYRAYIANQPGPKIVVVQDLDKPRLIGSFWGEVNSGAHVALGCEGLICDGAIRDVDEMTGTGIKALARGLCVGHAHAWPVRWGCPVEVFGQTIQPGQLIHADKHGFLAIPPEDEAELLEASRFMDSNECQTLIPATRSAVGKPMHQVLDELKAAGAAFSAAARAKFNRDGEW